MSQNTCHLKAGETLPLLLISNKKAIQWTCDVTIRRIIQTLLLTIFTKFCGFSIIFTKILTMFITGYKVK